MQQFGIAAYYSIILRRNLLPLTNLILSMIISCITSITLIKQQWWEHRGKKPYQLHAEGWMMIIPDRLSYHTRTQPWEDRVLPPHELNRWEDSQHKHLSCHHMQPNMGRTFNIPLFELNHREVHLLSTRVVTSVNHCSPPIQVRCL